MKWKVILQAFAVAGSLLDAQELLTPAIPTTNQTLVPDQAPPAVEFVCPMDKDVRSPAPGVCPRCGMKLVAGIPEMREFRVHIATRPAVLAAGKEVRLTLSVEDPRTAKRVSSFEIMHEKLFHLFVVSQDLQFFAHVHPQIQPDSRFILDVKFPHPGLYRVLSDFYPKGATPQLIASSLMVPGEGFRLSPANPDPDLTVKHAENLEVEMVSEPAQPLAGFKTLLFFRLKPNDGIEPYIGAMGHMLAVSSDLIDMTHSHPAYVTDPQGSDYKQLQFNMIFPREGMYRIWVQFQRKGVVNTVAFNVPVKALN